MLRISDDDLIHLAGDNAFTRGVEYAREGRVKVNSVSEEHTEGLVRGAARYRVRIEKRGGEIEPRCDCPAAARDDWCKHAVALAVAARGANTERSADELLTFLAAQPAERLARWLHEFAQEHPSIERVLQLKRSQSEPARLRKALQQMLKSGGFLDWKQSLNYARRLDAAIETVAELQHSDAAAAIEHMEMMLTRLLKIYERSDDSSGAIGDRIHQLVELYVGTFAERKDEGAHIGAALFRLKRMDQWNFLLLVGIWPALSPAAQQKYGSLIEKEAAALHAAQSKANDSERWMLAHLYKEWCSVRGDVDALIQFMSKDLSSGSHFEEIARICVTAGRRREAVQWAERGRKAFPGWHGLKLLLAQLYEQEGFAEDAVRLHVESFTERPSTNAWDNVKRASGAQWPSHRERMLKMIAERERRIDADTRDASFSIQLLLHDGDLPTAMQTAREHRAQPPTLIELAHAACSVDATFSALLLRRAIDADLLHASSNRYASIVRDIAQCYEWDPEATGPWVRGVRIRYKARRKLMQLMDDSKVP